MFLKQKKTTGKSRANVGVWDKASGNKIMLEQVSNPFGVFPVSFLSTNSLIIFGRGKDNRTIFFQDVVNRDPVFTNRYYTDVFAVSGKKPWELLSEP